MWSRLKQFSLFENFFYNEHGRIINRMLDQGYPAEQKGMCYGIATLAGLAILDQTFDKYVQLLKTIDSTPPNNLFLKVNDQRHKLKLLIDISKKEIKDDALKLKISKIYKQLSAEESDILEIPAFLDAIQLLSLTIMHSELFEVKPTCPQSEKATFPLILPAKTELNGGVEIVDKFSGVYHSHELILYFDALLNEFNKEPVYNEPFFITLDSCWHRIAISYDFTKKQWILIDANQLPPTVYTDIYKFCQSINYAFIFSKTIAVASSIFCRKVNAESLKLKLNALKLTPIWQHIHRITPKKVEFSDVFNGNWLGCAAAIGESKTITEIIKTGLITNFSKPLAFATQNGHLETARILFEAYEQTEQDEKLNAKLISLASLCGHIKILEMLIEKKIEPAALTIECAALTGACWQGHLEIAKILLDHKVDIHFNGGEALLWSARQPKKEILELLIKHGAKVNVVSDMGYTPLMIAAESTIFDNVAILLKAGADPHIFDKRGQTALTCAVTFGSESIVKELLKHNITINHPYEIKISSLLKHAIENGHKLNLEKIIYKGFTTYTPSTLSGFTALHAAAFYGHQNLVKLLIQNGANVSDKTNNGIKPIDLAKAMNHHGIIEVLEIAYYQQECKTAKNERLAAIEKFLKHFEEKFLPHEKQKIIANFKEIDTVAEQLRELTINYKTTNCARIKSLNQLHAIIRETYRNYALKPDDATIADRLTKETFQIAEAIKNDHESHSNLFKLYGKKSQLESQIKKVINDPEIVSIGRLTKP